MAFYDNITLEKGMYNGADKSFTAILEELDPTANYRGSELDGLDAYERQLKRFDIKVKGTASDAVSKFFQTSQSSALFPEYVKRCVIQGITDSTVLNDLIATNTKINSLDYRPIAMTSTAADCELKFVAEGAVIPTTEINVQPNLVRLQKRGRMLVSSYEAIKFQRLDLFAITLKQIGDYIGRSQLADAVTALAIGDGNYNGAKTVSAITPGTLSYDDLVKLWGEFTEFELNRMLIGNDLLPKLLAFEQFQNPASGINFQGTGALSTPLGAKLYRHSSVPANSIIGLDKNFALEMVTAADVSIESDKLIDRQLERASITSIAGFARIFQDAAKILKI